MTQTQIVVNTNVSPALTAAVAEINLVLATLTEIATDVVTQTQDDESAAFADFLTDTVAYWTGEAVTQTQSAEQARYTETAWDRAICEGWGWEVLSTL